MRSDADFVPVKQPFRGGERVVVVANEHYPIDRIMPVGVLLDGETTRRSFPPSALARLDPEIDDEWRERLEDE